MAHQNVSHQVWSTIISTKGSSKPHIQIALMRFEIYNGFDICLFLTQSYIISSKDLEYSHMDHFQVLDSCWSLFAVNVCKRTASTSCLMKGCFFCLMKGTTWGWVNDYNLHFFKGTIPLKVENCLSHLSDWEGNQLWMEAALSSWSKISSHPSKSYLH